MPFQSTVFHDAISGTSQPCRLYFIYADDVGVMMMMMMMMMMMVVVVVVVVVISCTDDDNNVMMR